MYFTDPKVRSLRLLGLSRLYIERVATPKAEAAAAAAVGTSRTTYSNGVGLNFSKAFWNWTDAEQKQMMISMTRQAERLCALPPMPPPARPAKLR